MKSSEITDEILTKVKKWNGNEQDMWQVLTTDGQKEQNGYKRVGGDRRRRSALDRWHWKNSNRDMNKTDEFLKAICQQ